MNEQNLFFPKFGKKLPIAIYIHRPEPDWEIPVKLSEEIRRAESAAKPSNCWNLLKIHTNEKAFTFLSYPDFDSDAHPALAEATKININTGSVTHTDYRKRANPPILHRKETFLPNNDPRYETFARLTKQEEDAGLLKNTAQIGTRVHWLTLLKRHGLQIENHQLTKIHKPDQAAFSEPAEVERHRTAIKRYDLSKPVKMALDRGVLHKRHSFFDYGCGHGMDIEALKGLGYEAAGWDPAFQPNAPLCKADIVNLGYVLNVVEEPQERIEALKRAYGLAKRALIISTMVAGQETLAHVHPYRDGFITKSKTFQKFFAPGELEDLIENHLAIEAVTLSLGICIAFRNPDDAEQFMASRHRRQIDWSQIGSQLRFSSPSSRERRRVDRYDLNRELMDAFWSCLLDLGRIPEPGEFDKIAAARKVAGSLTKAFGLAVEKNGQPLFEAARQARADDTLVYLAMSHFRQKFLRREIPLRTKNDIKAFFGDLARAKDKARDLLFAAGDPGEIELAIEPLDFGVYDPDEKQFTFHRSFLDELPAILRVYVQCGAVRYGNPAEADLIKIHARSSKLTFLHYKNFDRSKTPQLETRIKINLRNQFVQVFDHTPEQQTLPSKAVFLHRTKKKS
jgi:DNA phosphorothioation-associated putative methyltransferase